MAGRPVQGNTRVRQKAEGVRSGQSFSCGFHVKEETRQGKQV